MYPDNMSFTKPPGDHRPPPEEKNQRLRAILIVVALFLLFVGSLGSVIASKWRSVIIIKDKPAVEQQSPSESDSQVLQME